MRPRTTFPQISSMTNIRSPRSNYSFTSIKGLDFTMKFLTKVAYWGSGLGILGAGWLWVVALLSGFSANHVVCYGGSAGSCTSSNSPYWQSSTVLWLSPFIILLIALVWFVPMLILPKKTPQVFSALIVLCGLGFVAYFASTLAAGNRL